MRKMKMARSWLIAPVLAAGFWGCLGEPVTSEADGTGAVAAKQSGKGNPDKEDSASGDQLEPMCRELRLRLAETDTAAVVGARLLADYLSACLHADSGDGVDCLPPDSLPFDTLGPDHERPQPGEPGTDGPDLGRPD